MATPNQESAPEVAPLPLLDDGTGPASRISAGHVDELVDAVMDRFDERPRRRGLSHAPRWLLAAAVFAVAGAAAATAVVVSRSPEPAAPPVAPTPSAAPMPKRQLPAAPAGQQTSDPIEAEPEAEPEETPEVTATAKPETREQRAQAARDLLKSANALRRKGQWSAAEQAYAQVMSRYPGTSQAYVATLATASLRLEHLRDPAGALRLYQGVLKGGSLGEEAQFGVARCHRAMGNTSAEAAALRRFIATRPGSLMRAQAERRLRQIEGGR